MWGPLEAGLEKRTVWQVGAWSDPESAKAAVERLAEQLGAAAAVTSEVTAEGLVRVRAEWTGTAPEDPAAALSTLGFPGAFAVAGPAVVKVTGTAGGVRSSGPILLEPVGEWPTAVAGGRYRGRFEVRASTGGELLVINQLNLETYLRGVVPAEMGPFAFPELDALKAQTVAARTYAVAHLGDHEEDGYDLCDTPACQVYKGVGVEHGLTDRAVRETAGIIATFAGAPIDAMYTSTCGGRTEDAAELFPDRAQPYLKGVTCAWDRPLGLTGVAGASGWMSRGEFAAEVVATALGVPPAAPPAAVLARVAALCVGRSEDPPAGAGAEAAARALLAAGGLDAAASTLASGRSAVDRLLTLADLYGAPLDPPESGVDPRWLRSAALAVLEIQGVVKQDRGEAVPRPDGVGIYPRRASGSEPLPSPLPLYEQWREGYRRVATSELLPGTPLERWRAGDTVVALVVQRSGGGGEADRRSAWRSWARERSWAEIARRLGVPDLDRLEVTRRSPSGRVVGLAGVGASGTRKEVTGFDVRLVLGLPETLFTFHRVHRPGGEDVVRFLGRGWGHGVGLCQNGAYGLARSGLTYDRILATYYTGVKLERWGGDSGKGKP